MELSSKAGYGYAAAAYGLWGFLPLYIALAEPTGSIEFIAWRILWSVVFCAVLITVLRQWRETRRLLRDRRAVLTLGLAGLLIALNWFIYVVSVMTGHTIEAALGYFLNPLVSILLGLVFLRERLRRLQWVAVGIAAIAMIVLAVGYGKVPWIAIVLACTFGTYGLVKKRVGASAGAIPGFFVETMLISPIGIASLVWVAVAGGGITFGTVSLGNTLVLVGAGVVTSLPLLSFAAAASRLTLVEIGMMQFIAPIMQLIIGVWLFGEAMPPERLAGFIIVWVALAVFVIDLGIASGRQRRGTAHPEPWRAGRSGR